MKITTILIVLSILMFSCNQPTNEKQDDLSKTNSPEASFKADYPDVKDYEWEEEAEYKEVEFEYDGLEVSVLYDKEGNFIQKEIEMAVSELPEVITTYITENYPKAEVEEAETLESKEGNFFEVEIENENDEEVELIFDSDGNFLKEIIELEDESKEDDNEGEEENEVEIEISALPQTVTDYINQNYANHTILEAEQETTEEGVFYEVELQTPEGSELDLIFDSEGNFLNEEVED